MLQDDRLEDVTVVPFSAAWDHAHDGACAGNVLARVDFEQPFSLKVIGI